MYVRLGFSVAVNMDPEVLLVDEVLAVGDEAFQRKCLDRVRQFQREGRTIVFVTHAADLVRQICDRAAVLDHGNMVALGKPGEAVRSFREHLLRGQRYEEAEQLAASDDGEGLPGASPRNVKKKGAVAVSSVELDHPGTGERPYLLPGEPLEVRVAYDVAEPISDVVFGVAVYDIEGRMLFGSNTDLLGVDLGRLTGSGQVVFSFAGIPLLDGTYWITIGVHSTDHATVYDWHEQEYEFQVMNPTTDPGLLYVPVKFEMSADHAADEAAS